MRRALALPILVAACSADPPNTQTPPNPSGTASASNGGGGNASAPKKFENPGGMWMPSQIPGLAKDLQHAGYELDASTLSDLAQHPLSAVVSLGGCSASFVSKDGLVATNHHCVTGALQHNSTKTNDLKAKGFAAKKHEEEVWAGPGSKVLVTERLEDVTAKVKEGLEAIADPKARYAELEKRTKTLVKTCEEGTKSRRCSVASYFGGDRYFLVHQLEIKDVRLVFAPPEGVGDYGGEIDNFRWPRHGGDFAFYRAYVGKDGKPAPNAKDNVPYKPPSFLKIASKPLVPGDFVAVAGYPGNTDRFRTAADLEFASSWQYPRRVSLCDDYIALQSGLSKGKPDLENATHDLMKGLDNSRTFFKGVLDGFSKGGVLAKKKKQDEDLRAAAKADPELAKILGDSLDRIQKLLDDQKATRDGDADVGEAARFVKLLSAATTIVRMAEERAKKDDDRDPSYQQRNWERHKDGLKAITKKYDRRIDEPTMELAVQRALRHDKGSESPLVVALFGGKVPAKDVEKEVKKLVKAAYDKTKLGSEKDRLALFDKATEAELAKSADPLIKLAVALRPTMKATEERDKAFAGEVVFLRPKYVAALRKLAGKELAPDANGTLRITFGTVRGYKPTADAALYHPFSTLAEAVKKHTGKDPFDAPKKLLDVKASGALGPYADAKLGDVPIDFLSDLDTTGGNSGSPTLNSKGELCGLLFDGNYEAMASDWVFLPEVTRSIHVDIRYVLFTLDVFGGDAVLEELGQKPAIPG